MSDEKKNAPPEVDAATEKIDLGKKKQQSGETPTEKIDTASDKPESSEDSAATAPEAEEPATEPSTAPSTDPAAPTAKPTAAPRRIPPRDPADVPAKPVAAEKKSPAAEPQRAGPQQVGPQQVGPQRIGPPPSEPEKPSHKKWWAALVAAVVVIVAVATGAYLLLDRTSIDDSPEAQIRSTVESFTRALADGDLATLRSTSCGDLATFYRDIPDAEFADVHRVSVEQGSIPTVDSVDAIQVNDDTTAIAQVIAHTDANPDDRSPRTFDLRLEGEQWKVCS
ncbi:MAG: hypothetical protein ACOH2Q_15270 [Rhodococcus sp. (in: high G+C Gram-positive bacteria)]